MTSDVTVKSAVQQHLVFHCHCGATIETTAKRQTCWSCGDTVEVVRCVSTSHGIKYTLRIRKRRRTWGAEPFPGPQVWSRAATNPMWGRPVERDLNQRCLRLGLWILLAPLYLPLC